MAVGRRPKRHNPEAERMTFTAELEHCIGCGQPLSSAGCAAHSAKNVQTLDGEFYVVAYSRRCLTAGCSNFGQHYHAAGHLKISLPYSTYGLDVVAYVGIQRERHHKQFIEIEADLNERGIGINDKSVGRLYRQFLALVSGAWPQRRARLKQAARQYGGLVLAVDGLAPDGEGPQLYVMWEVLSGTPISGVLLDKADTPHVTDWMRKCKELLDDLPVDATMCDGQDALLAGLKANWKEARHGLCQSHYSNNLAKPIEEDDRVLKKELQEQLARLQGVPNLTPEEAETRVESLLATSETVPEEPIPDHEDGHSPPVSPAKCQGSRFADLLFAQATPPTSVETLGGQLSKDQAEVVQWERYYGYYRRAIRDALTRPSRRPFQYGGLQGHDQLVGINQALLVRQARWGADPYLDGLQRRVQTAIAATKTQAEAVSQAKDCLVEVERCLEQTPLPPLTARTGQAAPSLPCSQAVEQRLEQIFGDLAQRAALGLTAQRLLEKQRQMAKDWLPGILHCYDVPGLPRHNLKLEGLFGTLRRNERRVSGRKETSPLRVFGPGELMFTTLKEEEVLPWLQSVPVEVYWAQRRQQEEREEPRRWLRRLRHDPVQALAQVDQQFYAVIKERSRSSPDPP